MLGIDITGITFGYKKDSREYRIAEKVCKKLQIPHIFLPIHNENKSFDVMTKGFNYSKNDPTSAPGSTYLSHQKTFSEYDAIFKGDFLTHSLREERFYQPKNNIQRLLKNTSFNDAATLEKRQQIKKKLVSENENKTLDEISFQKIMNTRFKKFDKAKKVVNIECPALDNHVLNSILSVPEKENIKRIMKKYGFKTYELPCTRSPFPLWFPWTIHYGYHHLKNMVDSRVDYCMKSNLGMGNWAGYQKKFCKKTKKTATKLNLTDLNNFEFIDKQVVKQRNRIKIKLTRAYTTVSQLIHEVNTDDISNYCTDIRYVTKDLLKNLFLYLSKFFQFFNFLNRIMFSILIYR